MKSPLKLLIAGLMFLVPDSHTHAQVAFTPAVSYSVGNGPGAIATADVNGDGKVDIVCANSGAATLSVLTNDGSAGFELASSPAVGAAPVSIATADFNSDGKPDLASAGYVAGALSVLTNNGNGGFSPAASLILGSSPSSVTTTDVNADGSPDLISANWDANTLSVLTNDGNAGFTLATSLPAGVGPNCVTTADVNGDGKPDLISANFYWMNGELTNSLSVLTNDEAGGFVLATSPVTGEGANWVTAADVNGDGKVDLITSDVKAATLSVMTNDGSGNFMLAATPSAPSDPNSVTTADVNGDGKLDLICTYNSLGSWHPPGFVILTNNGTSSFLPAYSLSVDYPVFSSLTSVIAADINGDHRVDLLYANQTYNTLSVAISIPTLTIHRFFNGVRVFWPSSWANWTLQQNSDLGTTNWSTCSGVFDDGTNKSLTVTQSAGNLFFHLSLP